MSSVSFYSEQTDFSIQNQKQVEAWLRQVCRQENKTLSEITFIFCSDDYLLQVNQDFLQHDYYTDVITFDYCEEQNVSGDIFISIDRVVENASSVGVSFPDELHRVMVHGMLHLLGYKDKTVAEKTEMTSKEDYYLSLRTFSTL